MPTYEYRCTECSHQFEIFARMSDPDPETCPSCSTTGVLEKVLFPVAVHYKGSGFYSTDYNAKKPAAAAGSSTGSDSSGDAGKSASAGESKPAETSTGSSGD